MGGRANAFLDESISTVIDPMGEETRELPSMIDLAYATIVVRAIRVFR